jgi:DNA-binding CsgD family transcriptional regulator
VTPLLSTRQQQILALIAEGNSNDEIAAKLGIGAGTVKTHLKTLFEKLGANSRPNAVAIGMRLGVLS